MTWPEQSVRASSFATMARITACVCVLVAMACPVTPSPKGDASASPRPGSKKRKEVAPSHSDQQRHPTVPRSRLRTTAGPVPLESHKPADGAKAPSTHKKKAPGSQSPAASTASRPEDEKELSASERAALLGGLLLAPAGIGGFLLGCSIGGGSVLLYEKMSKGVQQALQEYKEKHHMEVEGGFRSFESLAQLNEITVKAATEVEAEAYKQRLNAILADPENRACFDCTEVEPEMAVWASINLGVFLCPRCAGMHRALGTDKSRIKSAFADVWTVQMIEVRGPRPPRETGTRGLDQPPATARSRSAWRAWATHARARCTEKRAPNACPSGSMTTCWRHTFATSTQR